MRIGAGIALLLLIAAFFAAVLISKGPRPPEPLATPELAGVTRSEVTFESDGLALTGEVFAPDAPQTIAVIIHGSGASQRGNPWYLQVIEALTDAGVTVLLPDKRGSDGAEGDWRSTSFQALARDSREAAKVLSSRYPGLPLVYVGMSQGGRIAPLAARSGPQAARVVSLSGGAVPAFEGLVFEEENTLVQMGLPRAMAERLAPLTAWHLREVRQAVFWAAVGNYDPLPHWEALEVPGLIVLGGLDREDNVDVDRTLARFRELGRDGIEVEVVEGLDHALRRPGSDVVDPGVLRKVAAFVAGGTG